MGTSLARRESTWGLLFLAPWILGFLLFFAGPMLASLLASFTDLVLVRPGATRFIGLANWSRLLSDPLVLKSLLVTGNFMLVAMPIGLALPLLMAVLLNSSGLVAKPLFRALFFLPVLIPGVASAVIWQGVLNVHTGWVDLALAGIGLPTPDWENDPQWVTKVPAVVDRAGVAALGHRRDLRSVEEGVAHQRVTLPARGPRAPRNSVTPGSPCWSWLEVECP